MDKVTYYRKDSGIELDEAFEKTSFFDLPPEIRTTIYGLVFDPQDSYDLAFRNPGAADSLNDDYYASDYLAPLLTCRQFATDAQLLAFSRTTFVIRNPFTSKNVAGRLSSRLSPKQISCLRSIAFVAGPEHFRQMRNWSGHAFGSPLLKLDSLKVVLYRSSYWHYLFDFNTIFIELLRSLEGVKEVVYIKNESRVKPFFHTWYNRFSGAMMKRDMVERFGSGATIASVAALGPACAESKDKKPGFWWSWEYDADRQTVKLTRRAEAKADYSIEEYEQWIEPVRADLIRSINEEEYDPDPTSRTGF